MIPRFGLAERRVRVACLAVIAAGLAACGDDSAVASDEAGSQPLPTMAATTFELHADDAGAETTQLIVHNASRVEVILVTPCGISPVPATVTGEKIDVHGPVGRGAPQECDSSQLAEAERVAGVLASDPVYRFDGEQLRLVGGDSTELNFTLVDTTPFVGDDDGGLSSGR